MKYSIFTVLVLLLSFSAFGQTDEQSNEQTEPGTWTREDPIPKKNPVDKRFIAGGSIGASFGTVTSVDISPLFGYKLTEMLRAGVGFTYQYINNKQFPYDYKLSLIGGRAWVQHDIIMGIFAHAEYEYLNARYSTGDNKPEEGLNFPSILLGGGFAAPIGAASALQIQVLYPISVNGVAGSSINTSVVFRSSIMIGF
ncbi:MAG: hypothetical protein ACI959_001049 [Limisphaerales bacterium]|jgi:hypothetical protein